MKINTPDKAETIEILLTKDRFPAAHAAKMKELTDPQYGCGLTTEEAEKQIASAPIVLEVLYQTGYGLFALESEALESAAIGFMSPYNGETLEEPEEEE